MLFENTSFRQTGDILGIFAEASQIYTNNVIVRKRKKKSIPLQCFRNSFALNFEVTKILQALSVNGENFSLW